MKVFCVINTFRIAFELKGSSLITCENSSTLRHLQPVLPSYLNLPSQKVTLSIIPYYFTTHSTSQNSIFPPFYLNILFYSFFTIFLFLFLFLSFSLNLQHRFQHTEPHTHTETHDTPIHLSKPISHTQSHTHTQTQVITLLKQTVSFLRNHDKKY